MKKKWFILQKFERHALVVILGFALLLGILGMGSVIWAPSAMDIHPLTEAYYYTQETHAFDPTPEVQHIQVYKKRAGKSDQPLADLELSIPATDVKVTYQQRRLRLTLDQELLLDTLLNEKQCLRLSKEAF